MPKTRQLPHKKHALRPMEGSIHIVRGQRVMLDADLAALYEVPTKALNQALRRNLERFPEDFAFQLSKVELEKWRSQVVTSNPSSKMGLRRAPYAFTQEGVAMLSAVLRSPRAIQMSILIIRAFVRMRELIASHKDLAVRVEKLEKSRERTDSVIEVLVEDIDRLDRKAERLKGPSPYEGRRIGYIIDDEE
jgi:hypothetical protein